MARHAGKRLLAQAGHARAATEAATGGLRRHELRRHCRVPRKQAGRSGGPNQGAAATARVEGRCIISFLEALAEA